MNSGYKLHLKTKVLSTFKANRGVKAKRFSLLFNKEANTKPWHTPLKSLCYALNCHIVILKQTVVTICSTLFNVCHYM